MFLSPKVSHLVFFAAFMWAIGAHLIFPSDIEFKYDEALMLQFSQEAGFPALGMESGYGGIKNPGLSSWVFKLPAKVFAVQSAEALTLWVGILYLIALAWAFAWSQRSKKLSKESKEVWAWALAALCVSPHMLIYTRKIWAQSVLPLGCFASFWAWTERKKIFPALLLGLMFSCLGQIHMSGFFWALPLLAWMIFKKDLRRQTHIPALFIGLFVGGILIFPWLIEIYKQHNHLGTVPKEALATPIENYLEPLRLRYWSYIFNQMSGTSLRSFIGKYEMTFLGQASFYIAGLCTGILLLLLATLIYWSVKARKKPMSFLNTDEKLWIKAVLVYSGLLLTLPLIRVHGHYLLFSFPWIFVFLFAMLFKSSSAKRARLWALTYCLSLMILSASLLLFIRGNGGAKDASFGESLRIQKQNH